MDKVMLGKILNTLKYGNVRTKIKLYVMLAILIIGVGLLMTALVFGNFLPGLLGVSVIFVDGLILLNTSFEQKSLSVNQKEPKKKAKKKEKPEKEGPGALEWVPAEKTEEKEKKEENPLAQYDEKELKKIMIAYKVKKHHVPVMIDRCQTERILQSPAYLWNDAKYLYFLVLGEEPKLLKSNYAESNVITIRRGITARPMEEYPEMNEPSVVSMIFGSLLPKYYRVETGAYRTEYRKNLYSAAPGIWCTSASVKNMLKLLPERFVLEDEKNEEESIYFQEIYIARLMFRDGIYSAQEYKEKVLEILSGLIRSELSNATVMEYLNSMMMKGLIPREYADYVITKRKAK